ncbi:MAG: response regulator, partial [bacterium]
LEYYQKALDINKTLEKKTNIAGLTQNIGLVFLKEEDYVKARDYIEQSLAIYMDINEIKGIATSYSNLGYLHQLNGKYNLARINYEKALEQFIAIDSYIGKIWGYHNIGSALADEEKFREGLENLKISLNLSEEKGHAEGIVYNLKAISDIHEKTGNYKESLNYYKKYIQLNDSIVSAGTRQKIAELEANHKLALNEEELALKNIKLEQQETQKKTFIISSVLLLLITISLYYAYYQKNKTERTLQDQQHMLHELVERRTSELEAQIAERKIAEESDKLKTAFLANMSHELRTPMNAIIAFSSFLNNNELDEKTRETYIQHIHEAGGNLLQLIEDIIDSAKIESKQLSIKKEWCNISLILKELYSIFEKVIQNKEKVHVKLIPDKIIYERDCYIQTDKLRLKQIIANLLDNAIKFTNAGFIQFGFNVRRSTIEFYVKDSGIGIDKQYHDLIFDRFQQVNEKDNELPGGAGLGLAISKNLVHMLDGEMWVESEPGKGSVFYFTFKVDQVEIKEKISQENKKDTGNINKNGHEWENKLVLVAEDEDLNYKVLETILKKAKAKVIRAKNGFEAVELVREKKVDLVLMDIQMPKMDGYEATMEIRKMNRNLPIIAQTSYAMEGTREKCIAAGCNDYLSKPLKIDKLVETIDKLLKTEVFHKSL